MNRKSKEYLAVMEMLKQLIKEERRGHKFFLESSKFLASDAAKGLMERLAIEEMRHLEILTRELQKTEEEYQRFSKKKSQVKMIEYDDREIPLIFVDIDEDIQVELPILTLFYADEFNKLLEKASLDSIFKLAMKIEFDNFKYLVEGSKTMVSRECKSELLHLAQEEKEHFLWLQNLKKQMQYLDAAKSE